MRIGITRHLNNHSGKIMRSLALLCLAVMLASSCGCKQSNIRNQSEWDDFCTALASEFQNVPGSLMPNYIDNDGWLYFLAEDERRIYRFNEETGYPEAIIEDVWGCMTVAENGVLFLRGCENFIGNQLWSVEYDLILWQEGTETILWEDADISPRDGCMITVGDYLIYDGQEDLEIRPLLLDGDTPHIGNIIGTIPGCTAIQRLLWTDGAELWYGVQNGSFSVDALRKMDISTKAFVDVETSKWSATGWDVRHPWPIAVSKENLYYYQNGIVYGQDLNTLTVQELCKISENMDARVYGTTTGEPLVLLEDYTKDISSPVRFVTADLASGLKLLNKVEGQVQMILGDVAVVRIHDYVNDYDYFSRTALYRLDTDALFWISNGDICVSDS